MSRPACVLFDLDDTLVRYDHDARVRALAARCGVAPERIEVELFASGLEHDTDLGRFDAQGQADALAQRLGVPVAVADCIAARAASMMPNDAVITLAERISRRARLAILSNNGLLIRDHLGALCPALAPLFSGRVFCSAEFGIGKPEPALFHRCLERLGLAPTAVLFVDDKAANADAARDVGLHAHHYRDAAGLAAVLRDHDLLEEATHAP
jgi:HAD superfamily hydrolase (TIGR01509 family)